MPLITGLALAAALAGLLPQPAGARSDAEIQAEVASAIREVMLDHRTESFFNLVEADVQGGVVTLRGTVRFASRLRSIEREVARIPGVRQVHSAVAVPRLGAGDERIRREMVAAIQGHAGLSRYARHRLPPIRILVDRGRLVLAGRVASTVEKVLLGTLAHGTSAFEVENQVRVDPEVGNEPLAEAEIR